MIFDVKKMTLKLKFHQFKVPGDIPIHKIQPFPLNTFILLLESS